MRIDKRQRRINATGSADKTGLVQEYAQHGVIDHAKKYVDRKIHTNSLENFWSLLKPTINGAYVSLEPYDLFRYLDEQTYRFNHRILTDSEPFSTAVSGIIRNHLAFDELRGKTVKSDVELPF